MMTSNDHIGHDKKIYGDEVVGDKVEGSKTVLQSITNFIASDTKQQRTLRNRQNMLQLVHNTWIEGVLEQSLYNEVLIELGMEYRPEALERPWQMILQVLERTQRTLPRGTKMLDVFDETCGMLLILGEPGSGKTTMLLDLGRQAIERAKADPVQPIPVVFNLSSWKPNSTIAEWLIGELRSKYFIPKKIASDWVENEELMLLLDGLDEVKAENREMCVQAINAFQDEHGMPIVVCSRVDEYEALAQKLKLHGAVSLQPLAQQQVNDFLQIIGSEAETARHVLEEDPELSDLLQTPLMLSIFIMAHESISIEQLRVLEVIEDRRAHLFGAYIQQMFRRRGKDRYSSEETTRWLTWLAKRMSELGLSVFVLEEMRRDWLPSQAQQRRHKLVFGLISGLSTGLALGLIIGLVVELIFGLAAGLAIGITAGLAATGLATWLVQDDSKPVDRVHWSWEGVRRGVRLLTPFGLKFGGGLGLIAVLIAALAIGFPIGVVAESFVGPATGLAIGLAVGIAIGLAVGLVVTLIGLFAGLLTGLVIGGLSRITVETRAEPGQSIHTSAKYALTFGSAVGLIIGLIAALVFGLKNGVVAGLTVGLAFGPALGLAFWMLYGGAFWFSHLTLHWILYKARYVPKDYLDFLGYAARCIILRRVGGGYVFIHRLLMDYFASLATKREEKPSVFDLVLDRLFLFGEYLRLLPRMWTFGFVTLMGVVCILTAIFYPRIWRTPLASASAYIAEQAGEVGNSEIAFRSYTFSANLNPDKANYWYGIGWYGSFTGHIEAIDACERAIQAAPGVGRFRACRGLINALAGNYPEAINDFKSYSKWCEQQEKNDKVVTKNCEQQIVWIAKLEAGSNPFYRTSIWLAAQSNDAKWAFEIASKEAKLNPDDEDVWSSVCRYGSLAGYAEDVLSACEQAVQLAPKDGRVRDSRGIARALAGDYQGAIEDFKFFLDCSERSSKPLWFLVRIIRRDVFMRRETLIRGLETGGDPFNTEMLKALLSEKVSSQE